MIDDPATQGALARIFPLVPWALAQMQHKIDPMTFLDLERGTKASIVHNIVMREGERRFEEVDGIDVVNSQGLMHFALPKALIRVKHAKPRSLRISINPTTQTSVWTHQLPLTGMADLRDRLHLVYVPDALWSKVDRSVIAFYKGSEARDWRDIDVDAWYRDGGAEIDPFAPDVTLPPLTLKPGLIPMPLEELDGAS